MSNENELQLFAARHAVASGNIPIYHVSCSTGPGPVESVVDLAFLVDRVPAVLEEGVLVLRLPRATALQLADDIRTCATEFALLRVLTRRGQVVPPSTAEERPHLSSDSIPSGRPLGHATPTNIDNAVLAQSDGGEPSLRQFLHKTRARIEQQGAPDLSILAGALGALEAVLSPDREVRTGWSRFVGPIERAVQVLISGNSELEKPASGTSKDAR